jgi:hypothetical protein
VLPLREGIYGHPQNFGWDNACRTGEVSLLSAKKLQQFKETLEGRIAEFERVLANAEEETRANSARLADAEVKRLEAMPTARYCLKCQEACEQR